MASLWQIHGVSYGRPTGFLAILVPLQPKLGNMFLERHLGDVELCDLHNLTKFDQISLVKQEGLLGGTGLCDKLPIQYRRKQKHNKTHRYSTNTQTIY